MEQKITNEEIIKLSEAASLLYAKTGGRSSHYNSKLDNDCERDWYSIFFDGFYEGMRFSDWLRNTSMSHPDIPIHIKHKMFKDQ